MFYVIDFEYYKYMQFEHMHINNCSYRLSFMNTLFFVEFRQFEYHKLKIVKNINKPTH